MIKQDFKPVGIVELDGGKGGYSRDYDIFYSKTYNLTILRDSFSDSAMAIKGNPFKVKKK